MIENNEASTHTKELVYFIPGEIVLMVRHSASKIGSSSERFEQDLTNYLSDISALRGGTHGSRVIETLRDPSRRRLTSLRTQEEGLTTLSLDTGLTYDELVLTVEELNDNLRKESPQGDFVVGSASFNWLSSLSQGSTHTVGGPGAKPVEVDRTTAEKDLEAELTTVLKSLGQLCGQNSTVQNPVVNIAILDTVPPLPLMAAQLHRLVLNSPSPHPLAELLGNSGTFNAQLNANGDFLVVNGNRLPNPNLSFQISYNLMRHYRSRLLMDVLNSGDESIDIHDQVYKMTDHGLFIAGTISSFLSKIISQFSLNLHVNIHLIQVLNDYGVGTVDSLIRGLNWAVNSPSVSRGEPLIINCSLTLTTPRDGHEMDFARMESEKYGSLSDSSRRYLSRFFEADSTLGDELFAPIAEVVGQLYNEDVSIAAAAGNESRGLPVKKNARFPAAFREVMGVGALNSDKQPTDYTNKRDLPLADGADALGGVAEEINNEIISTKGVPGWYIGDIPKSAQTLRPTPSSSGWARWAGTSFATPRITLLLALLRAYGLSKWQIASILP